MSVLLAEHLDVNKGGRAILNDVSVMAGPGEFIAVIGPNGAGKSTLLAALAGLLAPTQGVISLDGVPLPKIPRKTLAQQRAYLPQNPLCEWPLSVERLVALGLTAHLPVLGPLPAWFDAGISKALEDHDLASRRDQPVTTLSGGEFSRAMLARAMVGRPDILIVDEPVTGLDPVHAFAAMARLSAWAAAGHAVIASLHDLTLAGPLCQPCPGPEGRPCGRRGCARRRPIRTVFGVGAEIRGTGSHFTVDFLTPKAEPDDEGGF